MAKSVQESKQFKSLLTLLGGNFGATVKAWNVAHPDQQVSADQPVVTEKPVAKKAAKKTTKAAKSAVKPVKSVVADGPSTSQDLSNVLVAQAGLVHVRGRVYTTPALIEAQVRVLKTGTPEIIRTNEKHHTKAVVVFRTVDEASVALQNLGEPN